MKTFFRLIVAVVAISCAVACGEKSSLPDYLNPEKDIELRIDDAMSRMTLDEKIAIIHAQSMISR